MARTYADWESQVTPALQLARLRLFRQELSEEIKRGVDSQGHSVNSADVMRLYEVLSQDVTRLEGLVRSSPTSSNRLISPVFTR